MNTKLNEYTEGLIPFEYCFGFDWFHANGFTMTKYDSWILSEREETEIQILEKGELKAVRIITSVETYSEGTLLYQSLYISPNSEEFFQSAKNKVGI